MFQVNLRLLLITVAFLMCILAIGCSDSDPIVSNPADPGDHWVNPTYQFPSDIVVEPGQGYPFPSLSYPYDRAGARSVAELNEFCDRIKDEFKDSGMNSEEAEKFYASLGEIISVQDGYYGFPTPNLPLPPPVIFEERILIKKVSDSEYRIFFYQIGCGMTYSYTTVTVDKNGVLSIEPVERWQENFPC